MERELGVGQKGSEREEDNMWDICFKAVGRKEVGV